MFYDYLTLICEQAILKLTSNRTRFSRSRCSSPEQVIRLDQCATLYKTINKPLTSINWIHLSLIHQHNKKGNSEWMIELTLPTEEQQKNSTGNWTSIRMYTLIFWTFQRMSQLTSIRAMTLHYLGSATESCERPWTIWQKASIRLWPKSQWSSDSKSL